ncbi:glycosyltransferase family 4 protein [uncultured Sphingomonas sp.]|uniref:glycosyltransferase family 4 protein n=1 Tax=uncultured Sphingomonas sp. TaxID=158754 RepID=UPI0025F7CE8F|nr:glycosyltransferase family 4 protein [uncultured Sphingomonas sp.]
MTERTARLRLLMTVDTVGGVWQYATDLARALAPLGVETVLAVLGPAPNMAQRNAAKAIAGVRLVETGLPLDWLADDREQVLLAGRRIAELACHLNVDLVQLNQPAIAAEARFPVPVVAVSHSCLATWWAAVESGPLPQDFDWRVALHAEGLRKAGKVVTPSAAFAAATQAAYALVVAPTAVHNGRAPLTCPPTAMHDFAFTAGRLWDRGKNIATLDRAAARLGLPVKAAGSLAGPNGDRVTTEHLIPVGHVDEEDLAGCLAARPVFVSAALYEPFGLAVLEAAGAGCPLVLSDIPTFRELWDGVATFVAPCDHAGFARAIEEIVGDTARRLTQGEAARAAARRFTPDHMAGDMLAIYRTLLPSSTPDRVAA